MGAAFTQEVDILNRALQHVGAKRISTVSDTSKNAQEMAFAYDKLRQAELRRSVWRFATRRVALRAHTSTTKRFIAPAWSSSSVSYVIGSVVQDTNGVYWVCMVAHTSSSTNGPGSYQTGQPQNWQQYFGPLTGDTYSSSVSYYAGELVYTAGSPDAWYISLINANLNNTVSTTADWTPIASTGTTDVPINVLSPVGPSVTIPTTNGRARNIFWLPNGYMRVAAPDPRVENAVTLNTSAALAYLDWELENNYIVSSSTGPIFFRFCGDVSDVTSMDPLFCEALGARLAYETCELFTQSNVKLQASGQAYMKFIADARKVNSIETANSEPDEDAYDPKFDPSGVTEGAVAPAGQ